MTKLASIERFLKGKRIALVGVSRHSDDFSRAVYAELIQRGYEVIPVRPDLDAIDGVRAYPRLQDVPGKLDGAILMTAPQVTARIVRDCAAAQVPRVWMHRGIGRGAVDLGAVRFCKAHSIEVIAGECPLMFLPNAAGVHKFHATLKRAAGTYPRASRRAPPSVAVLLGHGLVGWALCAVTMAVLMATVPSSLAVWLHAVVAPMLFGLVCAQYFKRSNAFSPLFTASTFVAMVGLLDLTVVALFVQHSFDMFRSFAGVWLPMFLIFTVTLVIGTARPTLRVRRTPHSAA